MKHGENQLATPMKSIPSVPGPNEGAPGHYGAHNVESVSKPADYGQGDIKTRFFEEVTGTPAELRTPMGGEPEDPKKKKPE